MKFRVYRSLIVISVVLLLPLGFLSCESDNSQEDDLIFGEDSEPENLEVIARYSGMDMKYLIRVEDGKEDFEDFYNAFHKDTAFQMKRIQFPIDGYDISGAYNPNDSAEFIWTKKNWKTHGLPDTTGTGLRIAYREIEDTIFEEIFLPNSGFSINRTFVNFNGSWFLTFYGSMSL